MIINQSSRNPQSWDTVFKPVLELFWILSNLLCDSLKTQRTTAFICPIFVTVILLWKCLLLSLPNSALVHNDKCMSQSYVQIGDKGTHGKEHTSEPLIVGSQSVHLDIPITYAVSYTHLTLPTNREV